MEITLKAPADKATIKAEIAKFRGEIARRETEIEILREGIEHYERQCDHAGQKTGYNERDGSWANPCPTCGYCY